MPTSPERFHIGRDTWTGLKNLYGLLTEYLAQVNKHVEQNAVKSPETLKPENAVITTSADAHRDAATDSAQMLENKVRAGRKLTDDETKVWNNILRDNNLEMLRARLRAFELYDHGRKGSPTIKSKCLVEKNSSLQELHAYIIDNGDAIRLWLQKYELELPIIVCLLGIPKESAINVPELLHRDVFKSEI